MFDSPRNQWGRVAFGVVLALGCGKGTPTAQNSVKPDAPLSANSAPPSSVQRAAGKPSPHDKMFTQLTSDETGINFVIQWDKPAIYDRVFYSQNTGGGVCVGDYDADGLPDIYLTRPSGGNRLYRNLGRFKFADVTEESGLIDDSFWGTGASFVDIDNDGDLDIFACGYACPNRLYLNQGNGKFVREMDACGLGFLGASVMMAFADYDCDGDLDGYLVTAGLPPGKHQPFRVKFVGKRPVVREEVQEFWDLLYLPGDKAKQIEAGQFDRLYRNDGPGPDGKPRFVNVAKSAGIVGTDIGQAATWWDYNNDGWPDLYLANDYWGADRLYRNNGDGTFADIAKTALPHTPWSSMGVDIADINQDGWMDLLATDMAGSNHFRQKVGMGDMANAGWFLEYAEPRQYSRNALYLNSGTERFMEAAFLTGLEATDWTWSPRFDDFDNDGLVDVFITNGMTRDFTNSDLNELAKKHAKEGSPEFFRFWREQQFRKDQNLMFRNLGDLTFEDVSHDWGFDRIGVSFGATTADFDLDGDLDLVVNNMDVPANIYRNNGTTGNSLRLALEGTRSNRSGLGALVHIRAGDSHQVQYMTLSRGWTSTNEPVMHFGVGSAKTVDEITIRWPSGMLQRLDAVDVGEVHHIREPETGELAQKPGLVWGPLPDTSPPVPRFQRSSRIERLDVAHRERPFDDFNQQPLLPNKLSQLGPGIACADINGDARDDFYIGGAAGQTGRLLLSQGTDYESITPDSFRKDLECEDMGALFFDADRDGDLDLYVVSGGVEHAAGDWLFRDRLYLYEDGDFITAGLDVLPLESRHSGSVVTAADFDHDGDLDLFIGGRVVPGSYPKAPQSQLLRNESGIFNDVTFDAIPGAQFAGMVTSACWSDVDRDGWCDLLVTYEWGPIRLFENKEGTLVDTSATAGLSGLLGWWTGIVSGDIDNDGDTDFVVSNFGLNTKYHASQEHPLRIYYGDFDGSGKAQIVEAEFEGDKLFPIRGKSCSTGAIPVLAERFTTFADFGVAELQQIYTRKCLEEAQRFEVNTLESGVLWNDGLGHFDFAPLPRIAQISPAFGSSLVDVDHDGNLDLYLAQNFYSPQRETGHMDGGVSLLMLGDGNKGWRAVWPSDSGLNVGADAKSVLTSDLNHDGFADFLVAVNDGQLRGFESVPNGGPHQVLRIRLKGPAGNPQGIGSRLRLVHDQGTQQVREIGSTGGYLTQQSAEVAMSVPRTTKHATLEIIWPDGDLVERDLELGGASILRLEIVKPSFRAP